MTKKTALHSIALTVAGFGVLAMTFGALDPAYAYGPEGLFGGRPNPDSTATLINPVQSLAETAPERAETVLEHPRPDYDPLPIEVGSFNIFPSLEAGAAYDSNIYATQANQKDDGIFTLHPAVNAISNWNRNALSIMTSGDINYYGSNGTENYTNAITEVQGRYDILNQTWVAARGGYQYLAEPRTSPNNIAGSVPTTFNVYSAGLTAYRGAGLLQTQLDYDVHRYNYNNPPAAGNTVINESFRDRIQHEFGGKATYAVTENFKPYVKGGYNIRDYDVDPSRESTGYHADVGGEFDFGGITSLEAYIGWIAQNYSKFTSNKVNDGVDFGGKFNWNVTGLTSVALEVSRSIEETTPAAYNSFMATGGSAAITHELRRNIIIEGDVSFSRDDFQGTSSRQDNIMGAGAGTRWLINRNLYTDFDYNWSHRVSDVTSQGYIDHLVTARLGVQF